MRAAEKLQTSDKQLRVLQFSVKVSLTFNRFFLLTTDQLFFVHCPLNHLLNRKVQPSSTINIKQKQFITEIIQ